MKLQVEKYIGLVYLFLAASNIYFMYSAFSYIFPPSSFGIWESSPRFAQGMIINAGIFLLITTMFSMIAGINLLRKKEGKLLEISIYLKALLPTVIISGLCFATVAFAVYYPIFELGKVIESVS